MPLRGFPVGASGKEPACQCRRCKLCRFNPWVGKIPWREAWQPTPVFLPGESHGQRSLAAYSPWCCKQSDMTDDLALTYVGSPCKIQSAQLKLPYIFINVYLFGCLGSSSIMRDLWLPCTDSLVVSRGLSRGGTWA